MISSRARLALAFSLVAALQGCGPPEAPPRAADPPLDGYRRLDRSVVPVRYALDLRIDPRRDRFSGEAVIDVSVALPTRVVRLHAQGLEIQRAGVRVADESVAATPRTGPNGALLLELRREIGPGPATLELAWEAPLPEAPTGLYRVEDGGRWFAFTQFEPLEARRAFPGFDQPEFKTPFAVTLRVPADGVALSGGPLTAHRIEGDDGVFVFAETAPLPTYLVAFAVGSFEFVESRAEAPPIRIVTPPGKGALGSWAAARTPPILDWLTDYFGGPYPYAKLDLIAVPNFSAGAMENVGLVTFREQLLLLEGEQAPVWDRRTAQSVIAHELAHMWYGNLVTMAWWDDLWLNESFATWMANRVLVDVAPELEPELDAISWTQWVMALDSKRDARRIRQPIETGGDVYNAFDGITYGKGAAVLRMLEGWIGEDAFREGVREYMRAHAHGTGGTDELLAALATASGQPVAEVLGGFLDQPGTPLVHVTQECVDGEPTRLALSQARYLPAGSDADPGEPWIVPVCVAYGQGAARGRACFQLRGREASFALPAGAGCPRWLHPNADERGYYRWQLPPDALLALAGPHRTSLTPAERVALPGHLLALLEADAIAPEVLLGALEALAADGHRKVVDGVAHALASLRHRVVAESAADAYAAYVRSLLGPHLAAIGTQPRPGESVDAQLLRQSVLPVLADAGRDPELTVEAWQVTSAFLRAPDEVSEERLDLFIRIAAREGDVALFDALVEAVALAPTPAVRSSTIAALGSFDDAALVRRSLDLVRDGTLRAGDYRIVASSVRTSQRAEAWEWLTDHYSEMADRLGPMGAAQLPRIASGLCDLESHARVERFFAGVEGVVPGTRRNARLVLEDIERCARLRESAGPAVDAFLRGRSF